MTHLSIRAALLGLAVSAVSAGAQSGSPQPADPSVGAAVDRAVAAWTGVRTVRGTFRQSVSNALTGGTAAAKGTFQQDRPRRLSIRFTDPDGDAIVADGKAVWLYLPSASPGQVIKRPAADQSTVPIDFTSQFLDEPRSKYEIADGGRATVGTHPARILKLTPKRGSGSPFTRATVWIDDDDSLIRQFEVSDETGITRRIVLETLELNVPVDRDAFTFKVPKGVKVVDDRR
jgi:chaperone LolA